MFDFRDYEYEDYELIDLRDTVEYSHDGGKFYWVLMLQCITMGFEIINEFGGIRIISGLLIQTYKGSANCKHT